MIKASTSAWDTLKSVLPAPDITAPGLLGAATGAGLLGVTSAATGGDAQETSAERRRRILRNVVMGGALGGAAGAGLPASMKLLDSATPAPSEASQTAASIADTYAPGKPAWGLPARLGYGLGGLGLGSIGHAALPASQANKAHVQAAADSILADLTKAKGQVSQTVQDSLRTFVDNHLNVKDGDRPSFLNRLARLVEGDTKGLTGKVKTDLETELTKLKANWGAEAEKTHIRPIIEKLKTQFPNLRLPDTMVESVRTGLTPEQLRTPITRTLNRPETPAPSSFQKFLEKWRNRDVSTAGKLPVDVLQHVIEQMHNDDPARLRAAMQLPSYGRNPMAPDAQMTSRFRPGRSGWAAGGLGLILPELLGLAPRGIAKAIDIYRGTTD